MTTTPTILVVDDEPHITTVLSLKLTNAGFRVLTAADGEEALEVALANRPDLVITDLQMPYLSGLELCTRMKKMPELAATPAIMLTARGYALSQADIGATNIRELMSKPFSPRKVLERAKEILDEAAASSTLEQEAQPSDST